MRALALAALLAFAAALALTLRVDPARGDSRALGSRYVDLADAESLYRLRLVELTLVGQSTPHVDRFLERAGDADVPWPPLVHATLAFAAFHALERDDSHPELIGFDEHALERFARGVGPLLGTFATFALAAAAWSLADARRRHFAAAVAALVYAVLPIAVAREGLGTLHAQPWIVVLSAAQIAAFAVATRARERIDATVGALMCGLFGALALLAGPEAWPLSASMFGVLLALALRSDRERSREGWRALVLCFGAGATLVTLVDPGRALSRLLPDFAAGARGLSDVAPLTLLVVVAAFVPAWLGLLRERRDPLRAMLLGAGSVAIACALFDRRFFAPLSVAIALLVALAASSACTGASAERRRALAIAGGLGLVAALFGWFTSARVARGPAREATANALRWLREHSGAPGAFNHPEAHQDWRVLAPAELAGAVAYIARRPVHAASFDGASTASLDELREVFSTRDELEFLDALGRLGCPYVVVTPRMLRDPRFAAASRIATSPLAQLALPEPGSSMRRFVGLELAYASSRWETPDGREPLDGERAGPTLSIYRCTVDAREPPRARAR